MKHSLLIVLTFMSIFMSSASSCNKEDDKINTENITPMANGKINIKVGSKTFTATLLDNNSAKALKKCCL